MLLYAYTLHRRWRHWRISARTRNNFSIDERRRFSHRANILRIFSSYECLHSEYFFQLLKRQSSLFRHDKFYWKFIRVYLSHTHTTKACTEAHIFMLRTILICNWYACVFLFKQGNAGPITFWEGTSSICHVSITASDPQTKSNTSHVVAPLKSPYRWTITAAGPSQIF